MSARYTRLGQLEGKFGVPGREYLTASDFGGNNHPQGLDNYC